MQRKDRTLEVASVEETGQECEDALSCTKPSEKTKKKSVEIIERGLLYSYLEINAH